MKLVDLKFLINDLVRAQDENVYHKGQYLAETDLDDWEEDLDSREDQTGVRAMRETQMKDMRMEYQREAGYLEALKLVQEELKKVDI